LEITYKLPPFSCSLAQPIDIATYEPAPGLFYQAWRDLENELLGIYDRNSYFTVVTPDDLMEDEANLKEAVLKEDYT
jgi:hypothetical protein